MQKFLIAAVMFLLMNPAMSETRPRTIALKILHTSDVHSHVFDALPRINAYVDSVRAKNPGHVVFTDGGDVLQGHPSAYYYNFVDTQSPHLIAAAMNRMHYDVGAIGNHDIETGRAVFDRWISLCNFPVLGANVIDETTGRPHLCPYTIIERDGVRIAFLGLITPAIPHWVPKQLWAGLHFDDMIASARKWVNEIQRVEEPDLIVGLFHSGINEDQGIITQTYVENSVRLVAKQVPGFDFILYGHDHQRHIERVINDLGDSVLCIGPSSTGACLCEVDVQLSFDSRGCVTDKHFDARLVDISTMPELDTTALESWFPAERAAVESYMDEPVGVFDETLSEREAFFCPSAFIDIIHDLQLQLSAGAQISFAAPLSFDSVIERGLAHVRDMFALYRYENLLYTMRMTGSEIRRHLEMSYDLWCNTMQGPDDNLLLLDTDSNIQRRHGLKNLPFNFDSAAGICYDVDVSKPNGQKVQIISMEDGSPFCEDSTYLVAVNSYRGNGGGELLTQGAGIPFEELPSRIVASTDFDLRYHLIQLIRDAGHVKPNHRNNWRFVPVAWAEKAIPRDRNQLFGEE